MNFMGVIADEDMELITKRLAIASQSEEIQRQILLEDELTASVDNIIREKDEMLLQKYKEIAKKDEEMAKKDEEMADLKAQMASMQAMMQQILNDKK
jgi:uncharacterized protein (DUF3084 family)